MFHFQLSYSFRHSIGLLVLDIFPSLIVDLHQLVPLSFHLFDLRYNKFRNMNILINFSHLIVLSLCLFSSFLDINRQKLLFFASNTSKRIIQYLNFNYSLRILHNHQQTFFPERLSCSLTRKSCGCSEALNLIELPQRHNMQFDMIILPSEDTLFIISFTSDFTQKVVFFGLNCLEPTNKVIIEGLRGVTQIFNNLRLSFVFFNRKNIKSRVKKLGDYLLVLLFAEYLNIHYSISVEFGGNIKFTSFHTQQRALGEVREIIKSHLHLYVRGLVSRRLFFGLF